jgi:hypothetical protein
MFLSVALTVAFIPRNHALRSCAVVLHLLVLWPAGASAQYYLGADATVAWPYVWRGLTRANGLTAAPEAFATIEVRRTFLSAGAWGIFERGSTASRLSDRSSATSGFAEWDLWVQGARRFGPVDATLGLIHYHYVDTVAPAGRPTRARTSEVYGTLRISAKYLAPGVSVYWDPHRVQGSYIEGYVSVPAFASPWVGSPSFWIYATALVGYNMGQGVNSADVTQAANFADNGFTHVDFSIALGAPRFLRRPNTSWQIDGHLQINIDPSTQRTSAIPEDRSMRLFVKTSFRWTKRLVLW